MSSGRIVLQARRALAVLAAGLGLVLIAFVFAAAPLFVVGVGLCAVGALTPLWVLASARGARARRVLGADRTLEGTSLHATIEVHRSLAAWGWGRLEVIDGVTGTRLRLGGARSPVRRLRDARIQLTIDFPRRGEHVLAPPSVRAADPLDLARAEALGEDTRQVVLVLPRTEAVHWRGGDRVRRPSREEGESVSEALAATDLEGLRPYRPGSPASRIYWPALARGQGLIERRLQADGEQRPLLVLDTRVRGNQPPPASPEHLALDAAVRAAASLVLEFARRGGCGLLLPGQARPTFVDPELSAWAAVHARLAVAGTAADPHRGRGPTLEGLSGRSGPLIYVTAASYERLVNGLLAAAGRGAVVLVAPSAELRGGRPRGVPAGAAEVLSVSGCQGFALGRRREEGGKAFAVPGRAGR